MPGFSLVFLFLANLAESTFPNRIQDKTATFFGISAWKKNSTSEVPQQVTIYASSFTASANTLVCTSMSASVVSGHISAML